MRAAIQTAAGSVNFCKSCQTGNTALRDWVFMDLNTGVQVVTSRPVVSLPQARNFQFLSRTPDTQRLAASCQHEIQPEMISAFGAETEPVNLSVSKMPPASKKHEDCGGKADCREAGLKADDLTSGRGRRWRADDRRRTKCFSFSIKYCFFMSGRRGCAPAGFPKLFGRRRVIGFTPQAGILSPYRWKHGKQHFSS